MLDLAGDILNWAAAGVMFPLMLLPLSRVLSRGGNGFAAWLGSVILVVGAGALFAVLTPVLRITPSPEKAGLFAGLCALAALIVFLAGGPEKAMARLSSLFDAVTRRTGRAVMWLLLAMALLQFCVVLLRYVFGLNYLVMQESLTYMHGIVFLLAGGYALLTDDHVRVDIFYRAASPRRKAMIDLAGTYLLLLPVCLLLVWTASPYVAQSWAAREGSNDVSGIQALYLLKTCIPVFAVLLMMAGFVNAARASDQLSERG